MRRGLVAVAALASLCGLADRASAQVIYYFTPYYYNSPFNPMVRTYSTPVMYSTYTSPIVVPTRFVYPPFGTVAYASPPNAAGEMAAAARARTETKVETKTTEKGKETTVNEKTTTTTAAPAGMVPAGYIQP